MCVAAAPLLVEHGAALVLADAASSWLHVLGVHVLVVARLLIGLEVGDLDGLLLVLGRVHR